MNNLTVLWLDDVRDPYKYFNNNYSSKTFLRNKLFYDGLKKTNNIRFVWVKNFDEFTGFILNNGIPQFVSFDHDLGVGLNKGLDCAKWLIEFCRENNSSLPKFYVHSANPNGQKKINGTLSQAQEENSFSFNNIVKEILEKCH